MPGSPRGKAKVDRSRGSGDTQGCGCRFVHSQREVAEWFGVSVQGVSKWLGNGMPKSPSGAYDLRDVARWVVARKTGRTVSDDYERKLKAEADEREAKAAKAALDLKIQTRQFRDVAEFREWYEAQVSVVKRSFLALERTLPPALEGRNAREMEPECRRQIRGVLAKLAARP